MPHVALEHAALRPLYEQLYVGLRDAIVRGRLRPATRLASSRVLATELGVSRFTVVNAVERLLAEGYLHTRRGAGTYVTSTMPEERMRSATRTRAPSIATLRPLTTSARPSLSTRGAALSAVIITGPRGEDSETRPFRPRRPPLDVFPFSIWTRLLRRQWAAFHLDHLDYGDPAGYEPLRRAIAEHVIATRGVQCSPRHVIVTSGAQQAFDLMFRLLLDQGDAVWMEEPGYLDVRAALIGAGARLVAVPVDADGLDVNAGMASAPRARMAVVSPAHQYPTGATLSAARRMALLSWAERANAWIVEDDYDSYFRYHGRPLSALQGLDADSDGSRRRSARRVVYIGTFSKTMFPSLRLGYCIVPESLVDAAANARAVADRNSPIADQAALAEFMREGHYDRHLRRVRIVCQERYETLQYEARRELGDVITLRPAMAGTHVLGWPEPSLEARRSKSTKSAAVRISEAAAQSGLVVFPLSRYCLSPPPRDAIVLGYGGLSPARIRSGVRQLAKVITTLGQR